MEKFDIVPEEIKTKRMIADVYNDDIDRSSRFLLQEAAGEGFNSYNDMGFRDIDNLWDLIKDKVSAKEYINKTGWSGRYEIICWKR